MIKKIVLIFLILFCFIGCFSETGKKEAESDKSDLTLISTNVDKDFKIIIDSEKTDYLKYKD